MISTVAYNYVCPILWIVGSISNVLAFWVFSQKDVQGTVSGLLFKYLAVSDFLALLDCVFRIPWIGFAEKVYSIGKWSCGIYAYLINIVKFISAWMIVAISIERVIGVMYPLHAKSWCTIRKGKIFTVCILLISLFAYIPALGSFKVLMIPNPINEDPVILCGIKNNVFAKIYPPSSMVISSLLPFLLIGICNGLIIRSLAKLRNSSIATTSLVKKSPTKMLLLVSFAFIVLTGPAVVFYALLSFWITPDGTLKFIQSGLLTYDPIVVNLKLTNHAVNFFLYCLSGSKFRNQLSALLCGCRRRGPVTEG